MSKSYIPKHTLAVCTNMMTPPPQKLEHEHRGTVLHKSRNNHLLNIDDRKLKAAFKCKNTAKMWQGLGAMLVGVGIGLLVGAVLVAAVVATGGLAAVAIAGVAIAATGVVTIIGGELAAHDCDATRGGKWALFHTKVYINGKEALLQTSILSCTKGGMVSITPDPAIAAMIGSAYAKSNNTEVSKHIESQIFQGFITGVTALGSIPATVVSIVLGGGFYIKGESDSQKAQQEVLTTVTTKNPNAQLPERTKGSDAAGAMETEPYNQAAGITTGTVEEYKDLREARKTPTAINQQRQQAHFERQAGLQEQRAARLARNGANEQAEIVARRAANSRMAADIARRSQPRFKWAKWGFGIGVGVAGAVANFFIENDANTKEDQAFNNVLLNLTRLMTLNKQKQMGINIVANRS